ncbi:MAG: ABC transporter substrate-binding protein [Burkholderiales bacterium]|nr:ABC transporter substrate-binding protein [Burkholderiales bacterium]
MSGPRRHLLLRAAALLVLASVAAGAAAGRGNNTLNVAFPREVVTLDGLYSNLRENDILSLAVDDVLYTVDPASLLPVPLAALSHKVIDERTIDVELRRGVKFHDGAELTAEDVAYSYAWITDPKSGSNFTRRIAFWLESATATGPYTVRFRMKAPYSMFFYDLVYHSKIRRKGAYHKADGGPDPAAQSLKLNSTGPYRVVEFRPGQRVVLQRFRDYRAGSPKSVARIDNIVIRTIPDWSTQAAEVMSGGIDWTYQVPYEIAEDVAKSGRAVHLSGPSMRIGYVVMDAMGRHQAKNPFTNQKVRQAVNHAIDREAIARRLVRGQAGPLHVPCNPAQFGCSPEARNYEYSPQKARALLAEAGYPNGFEVEFWAARERPIMEAIVNQLAQAGIKATLRYVKNPTLSRARKDNQVVIYYGSSGSFSVPDAGAVMGDKFVPQSDENYTGNPEVGKLVSAALNSYDAAVRRENFRKAIDLIAEQAYWAPVYFYGEEYLLSKEAHFDPPKDGMQRLYLIRWK